MTCQKKHTSVTRKTQADQSLSAKKIAKTSSKKKQSKSGLKTKEMLESLISNISVAKGLLATLSLGHKSDWIRKLQKMDPEHLRILLLEVMEEIYSSEVTISTLRSKLEKSYMGICLH